MMKSIIKCASYLTYLHLVLLYVKAEPPFQCKDMKSYENECNTCICLNNETFCTEKYCGEANLKNVATVGNFDTKIKSASILVTRRLTSEVPCKGGEVRKKDCNSCMCLGGEEFCTLKLCPEDICQQPIETGPCTAIFKRFAFNSKKGQCEEFSYGGCGGNDNNFLTLEDCKNSCKYKSSVLGFASSGNDLNQRDICSLPRVTGPCEAYIPRFGFNPQTNRCEPFVFGGCGGNGNNFVDFDACFGRCGGEQDVCQQPIKQGPCLALIPRFAFNLRNGRCEEFSWGGCDPNGNNFFTEEQCKSTCELQDVCQQPIKSGPCFMRIRRYAFHSRKARCEQFIWGGCDPNGNNFLTEKQCENACEAKVLGFAAGTELKETDICNLPTETGPCKAYMTRFGFEPEVNLCVPFVYGGCDGNANNFETFDACFRRCGGGPETPGFGAAIYSNICDLPVDKGPCEAIFLRYAFMKETKTCERFEYGGCEGNANNFLTLDDCQNHCEDGGGHILGFADKCSLPIDGGSCFNSFRRYGFENGVCREFIYGGCEGNENNFETSQECFSECGGISPS